MKRVLTGTCLAAAFAVGLSAQTAPPQSTPQTPPTGASPSMQESRDSAKNVTVTGCLKAGDSADSFILSDLKWSKDKSGAVGTSGTAAPPAAIASATTLKLIPSGGTKLSDHVGHQVEVSGTVSDKASASAPTAAPADPAAPRPAKAEAALDVRNVKMIAATCSM